MQRALDDDGHSGAVRSEPIKGFQSGSFVRLRLTTQVSPIGYDPHPLWRGKRAC